MVEINSIKLRFGIIGNNAGINRALEVALKVATTDLSVLITGESGVGKEFFPQIIHGASSRKHGNYIAVNCGAIPEGTIDSELFGHEKGAFTGASESRKGYFEIASGGTIFLDEVAELPLTTQVRLLRVLQTGEFIKVGSSKVQKTDVRVVAATNINLPAAIENGRFREDLYYRLNTVPIIIPPLRERQEDIFLLFRKFASDVAQQYRMPSITLSESARLMLEGYSWPGNIRQLKNVAEQISVIEEKRNISPEELQKYLPTPIISPAIHQGGTNSAGSTGGYSAQNDANFDREMMFTVLRELRLEISEMKRMLMEMGASMGANISPSRASSDSNRWDNQPIATPYGGFASLPSPHGQPYEQEQEDTYQTAEVVEMTPEEEKTKESVQRDAIIKALNKYGGRRKEAAKELFISERTLYRRIKELGIDDKY
ncbi:MAG: sigma-54 dependent transcriptional regulator [Rikenellaceae bacterium]